MDVVCKEYTSEKKHALLIFSAGYTCVPLFIILNSKYEKDCFVLEISSINDY